MRFLFVRSGFLQRLFTPCRIAPSQTLRTLFARAMSRLGSWSRRRGVRRRPIFAPQFDAGRTGGLFTSLQGFAGLERRAMLAADDVVVSLASNRVVLTLDEAGANITDLHTSYSAATSLLTITATTTRPLSRRTMPDLPSLGAGGPGDGRTRRRLKTAGKVGAAEARGQGCFDPDAAAKNRSLSRVRSPWPDRGALLVSDPPADRPGHVSAAERRRDSVRWKRVRRPRAVDDPP